MTNLLMDDSGRILFCDWQGAGTEAVSGELNFFFGRLRGDGIRMNERETGEACGRERKRL